MKHLFPYILFFSSLSTSFAQAGPILKNEINFEQKDIGTTTTGKPITGLHIHSDYRIISFDMDTLNRNIAMVIRKMRDGYFMSKGYMLVYDLAKQRIKWTEPLKGSNFRYQYNSKEIIHIHNNKWVGYNREDGRMIWERKPARPRGEVITKTGASTGIDHIDLENHVIKWKNGNRSYYWYEAIPFNDTTVLISDFEGLSCINTRTGKGWSLNIPTAFDIGNAITSMPVVYVCSNILVAGKSIYFAGKDYLYCFDEYGRTVWKTELPALMTTKSSIFLADTNIVLLNSGIVVSEVLLKRGTPFIASFRSKTGHQNYLNEIKEIPVVPGHYFTPPYLTIFNAKDAYKYNVTNGRNEQHHTLPDGFEERGLINPEYFYKKIADNNYVKLNASDANSLYAMATDGSITRIDEQMHVRETIAANDIWLINKKKNGLSVITNHKIVKLLKSDKQLIEANCHKADITDDKLILTGHHDVIITELSQLY